jgi:hypothetical protein
MLDSQPEQQPPIVPPRLGDHDCHPCGPGLTEKVVGAAASTSEVCVGCGYDLAGRSLGETCPECGETIVENPFRGAWGDVAVRRRFKVGAWSLVVAAALVGSTFVVVLLHQSGVRGGLSFEVMDRILAVTAAGAVLGFLVAAVIFGLLRRTAVAVRVLALLLALALVSLLVIVVTRFWLLWSVGLPMIGACVAAMPALLARSSGSRLPREWILSIPVLAFTAVVVINLFPWWPRYPTQVAMLLAATGAVGIATGFLLLLWNFAVRAAVSRRSTHA